jgi:ABC-type branched-subunit amino acid transport system substrate-binding protein
VFDERKGEAAPYHVNDPRISASVAAYLKDPENAFKFFGHSVPLGTPGRVVSGLTNNTGWLRQGRADDALILETNNWDTHTITSFVAAILLKERVGYNVAFIQTAGAGGTFGRMAPREAHMPVHANVEVWPNTKLAQIAKWSTTTTNAGMLGAIGREGLFMTSKLRDEQEKGGVFPEYWRYLSLDNVAKHTSYSPSPIFNASLLGSCFTGAGGGAAGAEACTTCKEGTKWNCVNGTFVTPACEANGGPASGNCGVITMMDPLYSPGFMQQVTSNLNLSFQLPFVGYSAAQRHVLEREKNGEPVLFYSWEPDLFHAQNPGKFVRIMLPPTSPECMKRSTGDPTGGADCDFPLDPLTKFHSANLAATAGKMATHFFREMTVPSAMHEEMLREFGKIGANDGTGHFQAACNWLKANPAAWAGWILPPDETVRELHLGTLLPMINRVGAVDVGGVARLAAVVAAVEEINNSTTTLPQTKLLVVAGDSGRDSAKAQLAASELTRRASVAAVVGCASSGPSIAAARVFACQKIVQISPASTSTVLSDGAAYPYFLRTVPADGFQTKAVANLIKNTFGWSQVAIVSSTDAYGSKGAQEFKAHASHAGITVLAQVSFNNGDVSFASQLDAIMAVKFNTGMLPKLFVMICQTAEASRFIEAAWGAGVFASDTTVFGTDALASSLLSEHLSNPGQQLRGVFATAPSSGYGTTRFSHFVDAVNRFSAGSTAGAGLTCSGATDSTGRFLWQTDHDANASTPNVCAGFDFAALTEQNADAYASFSYDATWAIAHAADKLLKLDATGFSSDELKAALLDLSFEGATGTVEFDRGDSGTKMGQGDRKGTTARYDVFSHDGTAFSRIGVFEDRTGAPLGSSTLLSIASLHSQLLENVHFMPCNTNQSAPLRTRCGVGRPLTFAGTNATHNAKPADHSGVSNADQVVCPPGTQLYAGTGALQFCSNRPQLPLSLTAGGTRTCCTLCAPGTSQPSYSNRATCQTCTDGSYAETERTAKCTKCSTPEVLARYVSNASSTGCECAIGFFADGSHMCHQCPLGARCDKAGTTFESVKALPGFWQIKSFFANRQESLAFEKCGISKSGDQWCTGGAYVLHGGNATCTLDMGVQDAICTLQASNAPACASAEGCGWDAFARVCKPKPCGCRHGQAGIHCVSCAPGYDASWSRQCQKCTGEGAVSTQTWGFLGGCVCALLLLKYLERTWEPLRRRVVHLHELHIVGVLGVALFVTVSYGQVMSITILAVTVDWPSLLIRVASFLPGVNFGFLWCQPNVTFLDKFALLVGLVACTCLVIGAFWLILSLQASRRVLKCCTLCDNNDVKEEAEQMRVPAKHKCEAAFLFVLYLSYPSMCVHIFGIFKCRKLADGTRYLAADPNILCNTAPVEGYLSTSLSWVDYRAFAVIAAVLIGGGIPVLFLYKLHSVRNKLKAGDMKHAGGVAFIVRHFKKDLWWWEVADLLRKLGSALLMQELGTGSSINLAYMVMFSCFWTGCYAWFQPYKHAHINVLQLCCQVAIFGSAFLALLLSLDVASTEPGRWPTLEHALVPFVLLPISVLAVIVVQALREIWTGNWVDANLIKRLSFRSFSKKSLAQVPSPSPSPGEQQRHLPAVAAPAAADVASSSLGGNKIII